LRLPLPRFESPGGFQALKKEGFEWSRWTRCARR